jgi:hypothetical protein
MCTERPKKAISVKVGILTPLFYVQGSSNHETGEVLHITNAQGNLHEI